MELPLVMLQELGLFVGEKLMLLMKVWEQLERDDAAAVANAAVEADRVLLLLLLRLRQWI